MLLETATKEEVMGVLAENNVPSPLAFLIDQMLDYDIFRQTADNLEMFLDKSKPSIICRVFNLEKTYFIIDEYLVRIDEETYSRLRDQLDTIMTICNLSQHSLIEFSTCSVCFSPDSFIEKLERFSAGDLKA